MAVTFYLPGYLRPFADGRGEVEIASSLTTVGEALAALWARHPGLADRVVTEQGQVRQHVNIFVEDESIRYTGGLATRIAEGSKIYIVPAVSGG